MDARVVQIPQLRALALRVPTVLGVAETEDAFLGTRFFFITARATNGSIETVLVQRLLQALGFHYIGMHGGTVADRVDALRHAIGILMHVQLHAGFGGTLVAEGDHFAELPAGVHMQQRNRRTRRIKCLQQQVQQHRAVLAHGIQQHRVLKLGGHFAQDVQAFGFKPIQMGQ